MRPILSPRARVKLRSPADVGSASWVEGTSGAAALLVFLRPLLSPGPEKSGSFGLTARPTVAWVAFAGRGFADDAIAGGRSSVLTSSFSSTTTLRWGGLDE